MDQVALACAALAGCFPISYALAYCVARGWTMGRMQACHKFFTKKAEAGDELPPYE